MFLFSNYFKQEITEVDRARLFDALGIHVPDFVFAEVGMGFLLRVFLVSGTRLKPLLDVKSEGDLGSLLQWPVVILKHGSNYELGTRKKQRRVSQSLLPFPYILFDKKTIPEGSQLLFSDPEFERQVGLLEGAIDLLEAHFHRTELSCLFINCPAWRAIFFFHIVRRQVLTAAISLEAPELWENRESYTPESAQQVFGTSTTLLELDFSDGSEPLSLAKLADLVKNATENPKKHLFAGFTASEAVRFEL